MKRERIEKIARNIMIISMVTVIVADLLLAYFMDIHNGSGLLNFGYTTNLAFLLMFSCPVIFIVMNITSFIKEMILLKLGENTKSKTKLSVLSFSFGIVGFALYFISSAITSQIAIALGGVSILFILVAITLYFVYMVRR